MCGGDGGRPSPRPLPPGEEECNDAGVSRDDWTSPFSPAHSYPVGNGTLGAVAGSKIPWAEVSAAGSDWAIEWLGVNLHLVPGTNVVDLGCGDGRVLRRLVRTNPGIRALGYEKSVWPYLLAKFCCRGLPIEIRYADFMRADLQNADWIFCFLIPSCHAACQ